MHCRYAGIYDTKNKFTKVSKSLKTSISLALPVHKDMDTECAVKFVQYSNLSSTHQGDLWIVCLIRNTINDSGI